MELDFFKQPVIFINEVYDKMSNRLNILDPNKDIDNCLLDYGMQRNEGVMANVIVYVLNAGDLRGEDY